MNPRSFCRAEQYPHAVLASYAFDPIFFEHFVLPDLWVGGAQNVVVLADELEVVTALETLGGPLVHLGRRYTLAPVSTGGSFHPKVFLKLGPEGGLAWVGTGNITRCGWSVNQELAVCWQVGPDSNDSGVWVRDFIGLAREWATGEVERDALRRVASLPWLGEARNDGQSPVLLSGQRTLATQLEERWAGRRFREIHVLTGSTDREGAFLRWAQQRFGITRAIIGLDPRTSSLERTKISRLPLEVRIRPVADQHPLHAKFYWFVGPDGNAAVVGSPNLSGAAWLVPASRGGNIEAALVYDRASARTFEAPLSLLRGNTAPADEALPDYVADKEPRVSRPEHQITDVQLLPGGELALYVMPDPGTSAAVELLLGGQSFPMHRFRDSWVVRAEQTPAGVSLIVRAQIRFLDGRLVITAPKWVNVTRQLDEARSGKHFARVLLDMSRAQTSKEQDQIVQALARIGTQILHDKDAFADPFRSRTDVDRPLTPIRAQDLIISLAQARKLAKGSRHGRYEHRLSLSGIFRALFGDEEDEPTSTGAVHALERASRHSEDEPGGRGPRDIENDANEGNGPSERARHKLRSTVERFIARLTHPDWATRCTATQIVHAAAYPLAVVSFGRRAGWIEPVVGTLWADQVARFLLIESDESKPMLDTVQQRYVEAGASELYNQIVGDGTLWVTLCASLTSAPCDDLCAAFDRALLIRALFDRADLVAYVDSSRVAQLIQSYHTRDAEKSVRRFGARVSAAFGDADALLLRDFEKIRQLQEHQKLQHRAGDIVRNSRGEWAIAMESVQDGKVLLYVSRRRATAKFLAWKGLVNLSRSTAHNVALTRVGKRLNAALTTLVGKAE